MCSIPVMYAGVSTSSRARSPEARMIAPAPSVTGGQSWGRSGSAMYGSAMRSFSSRPVARAATEAISASDQRPASIPARACRAARWCRPGHSGATVYGSSCSARAESRSVLAEALPNPYTSAVSACPEAILR